MKAIGYIRVSTEEQSADDKYGIEVQKQAISDYANRNDFEIVCWLTDTISGAKDNRPELEAAADAPFSAEWEEKIRTILTLTAKVLENVPS